MTEPTVTVKAKLRIGTTLADASSDAFQAVAGVTDFGEFGGEATVSQTTHVEDGIVRKFQGSINYGTMTVQINHIFDDAGQAALQSAFEDTAPYNIQLQLNDGAVSGTRWDFKAIVSSFKINFGDANAKVDGTVTLNLTSKPVKTAKADV